MGRWHAEAVVHLGDAECNNVVGGAGEIEFVLRSGTQPICRAGRVDVVGEDVERSGGPESVRLLAMTVHVAVIGSGDAPDALVAVAEKVGSGLACAGATVICGGLGGVMAAACRGAKSAGGLTVGILPGDDPHDANPWVDVAIPSGLGEARNSLVVRSASAVIAIGGEYGTLSEIALALRSRIPVLGIATWSLMRPEGEIEEGIIRIEEPDEAVQEAVRLARLFRPFGQG